MIYKQILLITFKKKTELSFLTVLSISIKYGLMYFYQVRFYVFLSSTNNFVYY